MALVVNFKGVESGGGGGARVPEDDYRVKVTGVKAGESKSSGNPMLTWEFTISKGKYKGKKLKDYTTLTKDSLWKLMGLLEALGVEVPQGKLDLAKILKKLLGKEFGITVIDEEYEKDGKTKMSSKISDYLTLEDLEKAQDEDDDDESNDEDDDDTDDDEDEEPTKKKSKAKGKKTKKKKSDDDEIEDLDLDEL
jgi:hypothetical protein